jgi:hypothetical protein
MSNCLIVRYEPENHHYYSRTYILDEASAKKYKKTTGMKRIEVQLGYEWSYETRELIFSDMEWITRDEYELLLRFKLTDDVDELLAMIN